MTKVSSSLFCFVVVLKNKEFNLYKYETENSCKYAQTGTHKCRSFLTNNFLNMFFKFFFLILWLQTWGWNQRMIVGTWSRAQQLNESDWSGHVKQTWGLSCWRDNQLSGQRDLLKKQQVRYKHRCSWWCYFNAFKLIPSVISVPNTVN